MDVVEPSDHRPRWSGDPGARRLFATVQGACAEREDLPSRLEAGLRAALGMLAADSELAWRLIVGPYPDEEEGALDAHRAWIERFGGLLSDAVASDPRITVSAPSFLAAFLIGGVRSQIASLLMRGEGEKLLGLLPGTLEALLAYYFEPGEASGSASDD